VLDVERLAELRREHFVRGVGIKELARRYGIDRNTVRRALRSEEPPRYQRPAAASKSDRFKDEIHELLPRDPGLSGVRVRELIEPLGFVGGKTIVDDYSPAAPWRSNTSARGPTAPRPTAKPVS
jgi:transcriptional regulator with XRE-family HTH domain